MARVKLIQFFGTPPTPLWGEKHPNRAGHQVGLSSIEKSGTLDPSFYNPVAVDLDRWIDAHSAGYAELGNIAQVFDVPPFKHIYVDADFGVGFFTSADIFLVDRKPDKYLSKSQTKGLEKYALRKGWVLLARSGSLGGNIARVQFADGALDGQTASDHVIRIVPTSDQFLPGYLYTFLSTESLGYPLLLRTATGACVPALWPNYLEKLRVLRPDSKLNEQLDQEVQEAFDMRVRATALEDSARNMIESELDRKAG
jgi:type I restriction enzyme S subunit